MKKYIEPLKQILIIVALLSFIYAAISIGSYFQTNAKDISRFFRGQVSIEVSHYKDYYKDNCSKQKYKEKYILYECDQEFDEVLNYLEKNE